MEPKGNVSIITPQESLKYYPHLLVFMIAVAAIGSWLLIGIYAFVTTEDGGRISWGTHSKVSSRRKSSGRHGHARRSTGGQRRKSAERRRSSRVHAGDMNRRRSSIGRSMIQSLNVGDEQRIEDDAVALLARESPSEQAKGDFKMDRLVGWMTLYWDIPTMTLLPFMTLNVWPRKLRIPFHHAGSILYLGADLSFRELRVFAIWFSLILLFVIEGLRLITENKCLRRWNSRKLERMRSIASRLFYGAMYTTVFYQAGALLADYKSCTLGFGFLNETACKYSEIDTFLVNETMNRTTKIVQVRVEPDIAFDIPMLAAATVLFVWAYQGAVKYTLHEKNVSNPSFMWLPVYELIRYSVKTLISATAGLFKVYPFITMPTYLIGYTSLLYLTFKYQPCQGQGRKANNLRATGFSLGAWFSACGMLCYFIDADAVVITTSHIVVAYVVLILGAYTVARFAWVINDIRAAKYAIPATSWHDLANHAKHSSYVRKVTSDAILLHAEETKGSAKVDKRLVDNMLQVIMQPQEPHFTKLRFAAAYLLFTSAQKRSDGNTSKRKKSQLLFTNSSTGLMGWARNGRSGKSAVSRFVGKALKKLLAVFEMADRYTLERVISLSVTRSGRIKRDSEGTFIQTDVNKCIRLVVDALASNVYSDSLKRRIYRGFVLAASAQDEESFFKMDVDDPKFVHAMCVAHSFNVSVLSDAKSPAMMNRRLSVVDTVPQAELMKLDSLKYLAGVVKKIRDGFQAYRSGDESEERTAFFAYFADASMNVESWVGDMFYDVAQESFELLPQGEGVPYWFRIVPDYCDNIHHAMYIVNELFEIQCGDFTEARDVGLGGEVIPESLYECLYRISPLVFSTDIRLHSAALALLQRVERVLPSSKTGSSGTSRVLRNFHFLGDDGHPFLHAYTQCKLAKAVLRDLLLKRPPDDALWVAISQPALAESFKVNATHFEFSKMGEDLVHEMIDCLSLTGCSKCNAATKHESNIYFWETMVVRHLTFYIVNTVHECFESTNPELTSWLLSRLQSFWLKKIRADTFLGRKKHASLSRSIHVPPPDINMRTLEPRWLFDAAEWELRGSRLARMCKDTLHKAVSFVRLDKTSNPRAFTEIQQSNMQKRIKQGAAKMQPLKSSCESLVPP